MSESNGAAVDIDFSSIQAQFFFDGEILCSEGLVDFDQVNVVEREAGSLQCNLGCRDGAAPHQFRLDSRSPPPDDPANRLEITLLCNLNRHDDHCSSPIHNAAGVARCHSAILAEGGLQFREPIEGGLGATMIVFCKHLTGRL